MQLWVGTPSAIAQFLELRMATLLASKSSEGVLQRSAVPDIKQHPQQISSIETRELPLAAKLQLLSRSVNSPVMSSQTPSNLEADAPIARAVANFLDSQQLPSSGSESSDALPVVGHNLPNPQAWPIAVPISAQVQPSQTARVGGESRMRQSDPGENGLKNLFLRHRGAVLFVLGALTVILLIR